jgi:hypothetical protein
MTKPAERIPGQEYPGERDSLLGFRRGKKTISLVENPNALGLFELILQHCWQRRVQAKKQLLKDEERFKGS